MIGNTNFEPQLNEILSSPKKEIPFFSSVGLYYKKLYPNIIIICISSISYTIEASKYYPKICLLICKS